MDKNSDRYKAMLYQCPERIPISCGILPAAWIKYREELDAIVKLYPTLFGDQPEERDYDQVGGNYALGTHVDEWGCRRENIEHGMDSIVVGHPVPVREMVHDLKIPDVDAGCPHGFMYLRLQDLRGFEEVLLDFAEEPPELQLLIDKVVDTLGAPEGGLWLKAEIGKDVPLENVEAICNAMVRCSEYFSSQYIAG